MEAVGAMFGLVATVVVGTFLIAETGGAAAPEVENVIIHLVEIIEVAA